MDKNTFFQNYSLKSVDFTLPDGQVIVLNELTLGQKSKLQDVVSVNAIAAQANIVAISCPLFDESSVDELMGMSGDLISRMADKVLSISGFDEEISGDDEKN